MLSLCLLASIVSDEKSVFKFTGVPLYIMSNFYLTFKNFFCIFVFQHFAYDASGCGSLCIFCAWTLLSFEDMWINVFLQIYFSSVIHDIVVNGISHFTQALFIFLLFSSFFRLHNLLINLQD